MKTFALTVNQYQCATLLQVRIKKKKKSTTIVHFVNKEEVKKGGKLARLKWRWEENEQTRNDTNNYVGVQLLFCGTVESPSVNWLTSENLLRFEFIEPSTCDFFGGGCAPLCVQWIRLWNC